MLRIIRMASSRALMPTAQAVRARQRASAVAHVDLEVAWALDVCDGVWMVLALEGQRGAHAVVACQDFEHFRPHFRRLIASETGGVSEDIHAMLCT